MNCCCPKCIELEVEVISPSIELEIEQGSGGGGKLPYYTGPYTVIPKPYEDQTLETSQKSMSENMVIEKVPYSETTNPSGGTTVNIAYIL